MTQKSSVSGSSEPPSGEPGVNLAALPLGVCAHTHCFRQEGEAHHPNCAERFVRAASKSRRSKYEMAILSISILKWKTECSMFSGKDEEVVLSVCLDLISERGLRSGNLQPTQKRGKESPTAWSMKGH